MDALTLSDEVGEAVVVPALGAGLASFDRVVDGRRMALFQPGGPPERPAPFHLAFNLLVPWSGRVSGGGFRHGGQFHELPATLASEPLPIHGNGFCSVWHVTAADRTRAALRLRSPGPGPYDYEAAVVYQLENGALSVALAVTHRGPAALPYGLGMHPWFPRTPGTRLRAPAETVTLEDSRHLPAGQLPVASRPDWNFNAPRRLPGAWINNDFSPWPGHATILWEDRDLALDIEAGSDGRLNTFILYSPRSDADFFCFEPVTHPVDAHNRLGGAEANGLVALGAGETLRTECRFTPRSL